MNEHTNTMTSTDWAAYVSQMMNYPGGPLVVDKTNVHPAPDLDIDAIWKAVQDVSRGG